MFVTVCINPVLDLLFEAPTDSVEGRRFFDSTELRAGGFGPNVARALQCRGEGAVSLLVTGGPTGRLVESALREENLDFESLEGHSDSRIAVHEIADREARMLVSPSPEIDPGELRRLFDRVLEIAGPEDWVLVGGSAGAGIEELYIERVCHVTRRRRCCLDIRTEHWPELAAAGPRILKLPAETTSGSLSDVEETLSLARSNGSHLVLASVPGQGLLAAVGKDIVRIEPLSVSTINPFGAGDCLMANLAAELSAGRPSLGALDRAVAAATASVLRPVPGEFDPESARHLLPRVRVETVGSA